MGLRLRSFLINARHGGTDRREFWQRAEDRNLATAHTYDALGLPEYYAMEAFVKWEE